MKWEDPIKLGDLKPKLEDVIQVCLDEKRCPIVNPTHTVDVLPATVVALDVNDKNSTCLLGWKLGEKSMYGATSLHAMSSTIVPSAIKNIQFLPDFEINYPQIRWIANWCLVMPSVSMSVSVKSAGMNCSARHCNTWCQFAEPNMPDGKFVCFGCRQKPACMR